MALEISSDRPRTARYPRAPAQIVSTGLIVRMRKIAGLTPSGLLDEPFTFQVAPLGSLPITRSFPQTPYDTVAGVQRSRPGMRQLKTVSYQTVFTDEPYSWTQLHGSGYLPDPLALLEELELIAATAGAYFWLTVASPRMSRNDVNWAAALTDLNSEEREGEPDARYISVAFLEYRSSTLQTFRLGGGPRGTIALPTSVSVRELPAGAFTLYELARYYYGDPTLWTRIARANSLSIPPSLNLGRLGLNYRITIPARP